MPRPSEPLPRRDRWLSISDVLDEFLPKHSPTFYEGIKGLARKEQLQAVRRLVKRASSVASERCDECRKWGNCASYRRVGHCDAVRRFTKCVSNKLYVNVNALEALAPPDLTTVSSLEKNVSSLGRSIRDLQEDVRNLHGSHADFDGCLTDTRKDLLNAHAAFMKILEEQEVMKQQIASLVLSNERLKASLKRRRASLFANPLRGMRKVTSDGRVEPTEGAEHGHTND